MKNLVALLLVVGIGASAHAATLFEDHFDGTELDTAKWQTYLGAATVAGGEVTLDVNDRIRTLDVDNVGRWKLDNLHNAGKILNFEFVARFNPGTTGKNVNAGASAFDEGAHVNMFGSTLNADNRFGSAAPTNEEMNPQPTDLAQKNGFNVLLYSDRTEYYVTDISGGNSTAALAATLGPVGGLTKNWAGHLQIAEQDGTVSVDFFRVKDNATLLPEPASLGLILLGMLGVLGRRRRA